MASISVIVPVYKVEKYLYRCVNSLLKQTYNDFDLVLIDDGSPDQCGEICENIAKNDSRVVVLHRENGGLSAARNTGIEWVLTNSDSKWITFVDSDDWVHPQYLEILMTETNRSDAKVVVCRQKSVSGFEESQFNLFFDVPTIELLSAEDLLIKHEWNFNYAWGKLYAKELFKNLRYPEGKNFEDTFTTYKALFDSSAIIWIDREMYFYFKNSEGISHSPWNEKELVVLEGMEQQLAFYKAHGYKRAYEKEKQLFVNHHAYQIVRIRENKADFKCNKVYMKSLRKKMIKMIHESPEKYGYRMMPQCYEAAYPLVMKWYHRIGKLLRRIV